MKAGTVTKREKRNSFRSIAQIIIFFLCLSLSLGGAIAAPKSELWEFWSPSDESSQKVIHHDLWGTLLSHYLISDHPTGINRVQYEKIKRSGTNLLSRYLKKMGEIDILKYSRSEQKAFWINLYNALTVQVVLDHYPVVSIRDIDISPGWFSNGPWDAKIFSLSGKTLSLNDIEHKILRPIWQDNRIHYAVNCASLGCPNLLEVAYSGKNTETLLERAAKNYINHQRGVKIIDRGQIQISSIFKWYRVDFGQDQDEVIHHILKYSNPEHQKQLQGFQGEIDYAYDWDLNKP